MDQSGESSDAVRRLVAAAQAGDDRARDRLVEEHLDGLRAYVRLNMGPALRETESCSDVVQSICREVIQNLDRYEYRGEATFRHWLYRSALNKIIDRQRYWNAERRKRSKEERLDAADPGLFELYATISTPSRAAMDREDLARVEAAFDRLPEHYREVIVLSRIVGLPHREIALQMGRTEEATRTLLRRALVQLAGLLDGAS